MQVVLDDQRRELAEGRLGVDPGIFHVTPEVGTDDLIVEAPAFLAGARHFLVEAAKELSTDVKVLTREAEEFLTRVDWPGNVRQLENTCRWLTVMASGREILVEDLPPELRGGDDSAAGGDWREAFRAWADSALASGHTHLLEEAVPDFERILIETALKHTGGRKGEAAELLGWGRNTLTRKVKVLLPALADE